MEIPSRTDVTCSVTDDVFKIKNWAKHRDHYSEPYPFADAFDDLDGGQFTRSRVFADFTHSDQRGVISSIKWGYPRGGRPGGMWKAFSDAFRSTAHADAIGEIRSTSLSGTNLIRKLNGLASGVGTATTSKIAYFAKLRCEEGDCLIYDSMVRRALKFSADPDIAEDSDLQGIRDAVVRRKRDLSPPEQEETYGLYVANLIASAARRNVDPDQLELALFREGRRVVR